MASSFDGANLFGSGPHRFEEGPRGQVVTQDVFFGGSGAGSTLRGLGDWVVTVKGRLVAADDAALEVLQEAVLGKVTEPPTEGALVTNHGKTYAGMKFTRFTQVGAVVRGREVSMAYEAVFMKQV